MKALTGAKIVMHELDDQVFNSAEGQEMSRAWGFEPSPPADLTVKDGDLIAIGDVSLKVIHTPGHSPGGICLLIDGNVFTGDTLFVGGIGRTDLPGSSERQFLKSIKEKLFTLPERTIVSPGHDYGDKPKSTIGWEKSTNPCLAEASRSPAPARRLWLPWRGCAPLRHDSRHGSTAQRGIRVRAARCSGRTCSL